jgi:hypothetical protein
LKSSRSPPKSHFMKWRNVYLRAMEPQNSENRENQTHSWNGGSQMSHEGHLSKRVYFINHPPHTWITPGHPEIRWQILM